MSGSGDLAKSLSQLALEANQMAQELLGSGGELSPDLEARLEVNGASLALKADNYAFVLEEFQAQAELWKKRKEACASHQKKFEKQKERLHGRIKEALRFMNETEIHGVFHGFQLRRCKEKLIIESEELVPDKFKLIIQSSVIDRERLENALQAGEVIPGARLEENHALYPLEVLKNAKSKKSKRIKNEEV